jgi:hypothetical protein
MSRRTNAFTMVEMLVSMAVLIMIMVLFVQILNHTLATTQTATKHMDIASQSRVVFNRLGADLAGMPAGNSATLVVVKDVGGNPAGSDALVFVTRGRTRLRGDVTNNAIRLGVRAYRVEAFADPALDSQPAPMLAWGDGTVTWNAPSSGTLQVSSDIAGALAAALADVIRQPATAAGNMVQFQPLADGIFRFEVCFLLSDGTLVSAPPTSVTFASLASSNVYPLALSPEDSADPNRLYVKALVVGVVGLDAAGRRLAGVNGSLLPQLAGVFPDPSASQTPLQVWDINTTLRASLAPPNYPPPVLRGIRAYQSYYYVN